MSTKTARCWFYTLNNYTDAEVEQMKNLECTRHVCGKEVGESGTPHLQGTISFKNATRLSALHKIMPRVHWEITIAKEAAWNYCGKGEVIIQKEGKPGKRSDLEDVVELVKQGASIKDIKEEYPMQYIKFHGGIEKLVTQKKRDFKPEVVWIWGKTGTGKTRMVVESEPDLWISGKNLRWWNNYENEEAVLLDDFRGDFCTFHELLRILDRYPYRVEVKYGSRELNSKRIYITSCHPPESVYETREDIQQLLRRIDRVVQSDSVVTLAVTEVERGNSGSLQNV